MNLYQIFCLLLFCVVANSIVIAQENLVVNGDLEEYSACPDHYSIPTDLQIERCVGWTAPTFGTSDYFNSCASSSNVSTPFNSHGFQMPHSGNGYLGAFIASYTGAAGDDIDTSDIQSAIMWWEYVQGRIKHPLEKDRLYKFGMFISLEDSAEMAVNEIGVHFSETPISKPNSTNFQVSPQLVLSDPSFYTDTSDWMHLSGYFLAQGGEEYITIGNFNDYSTTDTLLFFPSGSFDPGPQTYYFMDDISLVKFGDAITLPNVFTPNGDQLNDQWYIDFEFENILYVEIVNRWGNLVAKGDISSFKWDGGACSEGVYFVVLKYYHSNEAVKSGFIHLVK